MNTQWIKTSDRAPTEQDLPVWAYHDKDKRVVLFPCGLAPKLYTHWRPAKADIPEPPQEETQRTKDINAYCAWADREDVRLSVMSSTASNAAPWHAALAYEREQVAKMLAPIATSFLDMHSCEIIEAIRARCGGGGQ